MNRPVVIKIYLFFLLGGSIDVCAQYDRDSIPQNWHLLDPEEDTLYGIGMERAYRELLTDMKGDTVIVAVIDTGIDTLHTALRPVLWRNVREQGNDEDGNGYQGDVHGWNFLGEIEDTSQEYKRLYALWHPRYRGKSPKEIPKRDRHTYGLWKAVEHKVMEDSLMNINAVRKTMIQYKAADRKIRELLGKALYTPEDMEKLDDKGVMEGNFYRQLRYGERFRDNQEFLNEERERVKEVEAFCYYCTYTKSALQRKELRGDDENDFRQRYYGNNNVMDVSGHGTHVAGIIGAVRENGAGMVGISDKVKIMPIRIMNRMDDELDKDVALAIRYAVDNGAGVINMSFAKRYSPYREEVEKAICYALRKDVVLVNGAGNDGANIDTVAFYPTSRCLGKNKGRFPNIITVGASSPSKEDLILNISNYGQDLVDVFAPGARIYSTIPGGYKRLSGTSMASPVVAGIAVVLRSYFPKLSARQVKQIIEASVTPVDFPVAPPFPRRLETGEVSMSELCKTGGIVNAYKAIQLAKKCGKTNEK